MQREIFTKIEARLFKNKAIIVLGARQVGKTYLLRQLCAKFDSTMWLDAENADVPLLFAQPTNTMLENLFGKYKIVVIDEAQKIENIGQVLKLAVDYLPNTQFIATGSSSFELRNKTDEPLTGRKWEFQLYPFSFAELVNNTNIIEEKRNLQHRLQYGCYPEIAIHKGEEQERLQLLANSYLFKDVFTWAGIKKPEKFQKLVMALALQIGNEVSYNELANTVGLKQETVESYIQILEQAFIVFSVKAYSNNKRKEIKKGKKIYFYDVGVRNCMIHDFRPIELRQDKGNIWENYVVAELYKNEKNKQQQFTMYFWRTVDQQEIDIIIEKEQTLHAYEIKYSPTAKARLSKTFSNNYPNHTFNKIDTGNYGEWIM
jgi:uncharacterized protein